MEAAQSLLGFCDEVVILDGESQDGTWEALEAAFGQDARVKLFQHPYDRTIPAIDGAFKQLARMACSGELLFQLDADEVVHEGSYSLIRKLAREWDPSWIGLSFCQVDLHGARDRVSSENHTWKWRMSLNLPWLGHGIADVPGNRWRNERGQTGAKFTDGCEMIDFRNGQFVEFASFYNSELEQLRREAPWKFAEAHNSIVYKHVPTIWHVSWADIARKMRMARDSWNSTWDTLRGQPGRESQIFGDLKGKTDAEIEELAKTFFLTRSRPLGSVDFRVELPPPKLLEPWFQKRGL